MHPLRKKFTHNPVIKTCASIKITVVCLVLLFILTLWGTIDQVYNGLYLAQARFFNSWAFTFWGFMPFPGARLVLWILFINLVCAGLIRLVFRWSNTGIIIIHVGLLLFFAAAFVTFHSVEESNLTLMEGETSNMSSAYHLWELSLWREERGENRKRVVAYDTTPFQEGLKLDYGPRQVTVTVRSYFPSCHAYSGPPENPLPGLRNDSGIGTVKPVALDKEPQKNIPGGIFLVEGEGFKPFHALLYGGEPAPLQFTQNDETYFMMLRHKRYALPFTVRLKNFMMERHPNTEIARSYKSLVEITTGGVSRDVLIYMNEPLRYKNYALYQASYAIDKFGREISTLAVVKNAGRIMPYIATFVTFAGLAIHFLMMAFQSKMKKARKKT